MALCCCGVKWQRDLFCFSPRFRLARRSWIGMSVLSSGTGGSTFFFFSSRRRHTRWTGDWSSDVCSSDLLLLAVEPPDIDQQRLVVGETEAVAKTRIAPGRPEFADLDAERHHLDRIDAKGPELRSEERRVGKEGRYRGGADH